jgi:hypothetical protein
MERDGIRVAWGPPTARAFRSPTEAIHSGRIWAKVYFNSESIEWVAAVHSVVRWGKNDNRTSATLI